MSSRRTAPSWADQARTTTILMNLAAVMERADESVLPAVYLFVGRSLDATLAEVGGVALCRAVVQALSSPLAGAIGDRVSRPNVVCVGAAIWGLATASLALSTSLAGARFSASVSGLGLALVVPCVQSTVADCHPPEERGRAFGATSLVSSLGAMAWAYAATSLGGRAVGGVEGWRVVFWAVALVSLLVGVCVRGLATEPRRMSGTDLPPWAPALEDGAGAGAGAGGDGGHGDGAGGDGGGAGLGGGSDDDAGAEVELGLDGRFAPAAGRGRGAVGALGAPAAIAAVGDGDCGGKGAVASAASGAPSGLSLGASTAALGPPSSPSRGLFRVPSNNVLGIISSIKRNSGRSSPAARGLHARSGVATGAAGARGVSFAGGDGRASGRAAARQAGVSGVRGSERGKDASAAAAAASGPAAASASLLAGSSSSSSSSVPPSVPAHLTGGLHRASSDGRAQRRIGPYDRRRGGPRGSAAPREWSAAALWRDVLRVSSVRSFQVLIAQGVVGSVPWQAMGTCTLWLQTLGFSDGRAAGVTATFAVGCALGSCLGGWLGDRASRLSPGHGRVYVAQASVLAGLPMSVFVLRVLPRVFFDARGKAAKGAATAAARALRGAPPTRRLLALLGTGAAAIAATATHAEAAQAPASLVRATSARPVTRAAFVSSAFAAATPAATANPAATVAPAAVRTVAASAVPRAAGNGDGVDDNDGGDGGDGGDVVVAVRGAETSSQRPCLPLQRRPLEAGDGKRDARESEEPLAASDGESPVLEGESPGGTLSAEGATAGRAASALRGRGAAEGIGAVLQGGGAAKAGTTASAGGVGKAGAVDVSSASAQESALPGSAAAETGATGVALRAANGTATTSLASGGGGASARNGTVGPTRPPSRALPASAIGGAAAAGGSTSAPGAVVMDVIPAPSRRAAAWFRVSFFFFGLLISWCGVNNGALMAELVPAELRSSIFALDRGLEGSVGALGAPVVGLIAERFFGSSGRLGARKDGSGAGLGDELARREASQATRRLLDEVWDVSAAGKLRDEVWDVDPTRSLLAEGEVANVTAAGILPNATAVVSSLLASRDAASSVVSALTIGEAHVASNNSGADAGASARVGGLADPSVKGRADQELGAISAGGGALGTLTADGVATPLLSDAAALVPVSGRPPLPPEAAAIGDALLMTLLIPWVLCFLAYCFEHWTFPRDRLRANKRPTSMVDLQSLIEGPGSSRGWSTSAVRSGGRHRS